MYAKLFSQIFDSSISNDYVVRHAFMDLLALADRDGHVDMTAEAIARRTNVPIDIVLYSLERLNAPDPHSRTPAEEGRRIVLLDTHRSWGWRIVNYEEYRNMRDEEARKAYFREYKRKIRASVVESAVRPHESTSSPTLSPDVLDIPTMSTHTDTHTHTDTKAEQKQKRVVVPDEHEMPAWLPQEPWDSFVRMRRKSKEPFTQDAVKLAIAKLGKMADAGQNVAEVLNQSTLNGWKGLFEIKGSATNGKFVNKSQQRANSNIEAAANYIAEIDGREAAADFVRGATGQSERYSLEDLRKPALEAPDRGRAGSGHQPVTIEAPGGGNSIPRPSHA